MPSIGKLLGIPESNRTYGTDTRLVLSKCLTGVEFEAENVRNNLPLEEPEAGFWEEKEDNSLRNTNGGGRGMEYVLREPLFGSDLVKAVVWLCDWATKNRFDSNYRTGLHIHIDCRNLNQQQLLTQSVYYGLYEPVIFDWVGDDREGSNFCMPMYKAEGVLEEITKALMAEKHMRDAAKGINRYAAYNLNALSKFGTVEWRHMRTTFNAEKVLKWINIAQSFKRYAKLYPLKPEELLAEVSSKGVDKIFADIVGKKLAEELWTKTSHTRVWDCGIPIANELMILLQGNVALKWDTVRQAIGKSGSAKWDNWVKKQKDNSELSKVPENPFSDPESLRDPEIQKDAFNMLVARIREKLDVVVPPENLR